LPPTCEQPFPNGSSCYDDGDCASKLCKDYVCSPTVCIDEGIACTADADCCAGLFCTSSLFSYAPHACAQPLQLGAFCTQSSQCQSKLCIDYGCVAAEPPDAG
jgi:hypothetical protein